LKICLVSPLPPPYGGISHWTKSIHEYAKTHRQVELIQVDTAPRWRSVDDIGTVKRVIGGSFQFIHDFTAFLAALRKQPHVIHVTTSGSLALLHNLIICATARLLRIPVVLHIRYGRVPQISSAHTLEWLLLTYVLRVTNCVVAITLKTCETIRQHFPGLRVEYIPNPIDCTEFVQPERDEGNPVRTVLFLGWVLPTKGVGELVQAWSELCPDGWQLLLTGPGSDEFQQEILHKFHPRNVFFTGELEHGQAMELMAKSDIFVLPSHTEGFPNVILEAMAFGKPILATSVGAIPEMLSEDCGILVQPKNVGELKTALSLLLSEPLLREQLGRNALEKVQREYCMPAVFSQYEKLWRSLAAENVK